MKNTSSQIVATLGPASEKREILLEMMKQAIDVVRFNFSWSHLDERRHQMALVRELSKEAGKDIKILQDLPGPRIKKDEGHTYDKEAAVFGLTEKDKKFILFGIEQNVDYIALSFIGGRGEIDTAREILKQNGGKQKLIGKIERQAALDHLDEIIEAADGIMIARGDLGDEIPFEKVPFAQAEITRKCKAAGKPVITATQMMLSMTKHPIPTRAEVTDVANAIMLGSDAVMLSEESAIGHYPLEAVTIMRRIINEAETHRSKELVVNPL